MNLVLDKLGKTDIQLLKTPRLLNIGMLYEVRLIGRYYIFGAVTCNALFWSGYASIGRITLVEWRISFEQNLFVRLSSRSTQSEMTDNNRRIAR
jgi:hypothetical protein